MKVNYRNGYYIGDAKLVKVEDGIEYYTREGVGEMFFDNGMRMKGTWANDKLNGVCEVTYKNGDIFKGYYVMGRKHGEGIYKFSNSGEVYKVTMCLDKLVKKEFVPKEKVVEDLVR